MSNQYPEIDALQNFVSVNKVVIRQTKDVIHKSLVPVSFQCKGQEYIIQVLDEYHDLNCQNPLLHVVLVLRELELIDDAKDYNVWCKHQGFSGNPSVETYYGEITERISFLKPSFPYGKLNSFISDLDFQLNSGAAQALRR
ncbi:MAG: hypothetical protein Aureis2KO_22780 [Aureisphaera sp.]